MVRLRRLLQSDTNHPLRGSKAFYFLYYAAFACVVPFLTLHYEALELPGRQIGVLAGLLPLTMLVGAPLWGALADATKRHKLLLLVALTGAFLAVLALTVATAYAHLLLVVVLFALFLSPIMPLVDNAVLEQLGRERRRYGRQRFWGAVGYGLAALAAGLLAQRFDLRWAFYLFLVLTLIGFAVAFRLPLAGARISSHFWSGLRFLLTSWQWLLFLAAVLIGGMGLSVILNFLFLRLGELGAGKTLMGLCLTLATISEMPVLFHAEKFLSRLSPQRLLVLALGVLAIRLIIYSFLGIAWLVLPVQLLHGLTFALIWVAGVTYAAELAPDGMGATAQGLFAGVFTGLGATLGALLGGLLYESVGLAMTFRWVGLSILVGVLLLLWAGRASKRFAS